MELKLQVGFIGAFLLGFKVGLPNNTWWVFWGFVSGCVNPISIYMFCNAFLPVYNHRH